MRCGRIMRLSDSVAPSLTPTFAKVVTQIFHIRSVGDSMGSRAGFGLAGEPRPH